MGNRIRIGLVYGGRSSEHAISVVSAGSVMNAIDPDRFEVVTIGITREGAWVRTEADPAQLQISERQLPHVTADAAVARRSDAAQVAVFHASSAVSALDSVDVVIPMLHGAFGEDGTIQGLLEMADIPYVGSGVLASAVGMDKTFTKVVLRDAGLNVGRYLVVRRGDKVIPADLEGLGLPLFVKPARAGSSVGITKVRDYADLEAALELAFGHDSKVLVEAAVLGREVECGVLQDADGTVSASLPAEIRLHPDFDWYDFDAKYLDDACDFVIPPQLPARTIAAIQQASCDAFRALECSGLARVDFFVTDDDTVIVNEINTMPGFTPISMYPRMWAESGVSYPELIDRLVQQAMARAGRGR
jgi:D-alanine-D-alanine ligase